MAKKAQACGSRRRRKPEKALFIPENLEGKLEEQKTTIYYHLGCAGILGKPEEARECFLRATTEPTRPAGAMYYNDQPADMMYQGLAIKAGSTREASPLLPVSSIMEQHQRSGKDRILASAGFLILTKTIPEKQSALLSDGSAT